jgi:hypothetical protein
MTPAKLVASLPDIIRVGPFDMALVPLTEHAVQMASAIGYFRSRELVIGFEANAASSQSLADTLIHEIGHAIFSAYGLQDGDGEERTISTLATGWTQVYRDNPWLLDWLKKALK